MKKRVDVEPLPADPVRAKDRVRFTLWSRYGFLWVTGILFVGSLLGHWTLAWFAYVNEQEAHRMPVSVAEYAVQAGRDTLENWQSEFLQLIWQVAG